MCMLCLVSVCVSSRVLFVIPSIFSCRMLIVWIVFIDGMCGRGSGVEVGDLLGGEALVVVVGLGSGELGLGSGGFGGLGV